MTRLSVLPAAPQKPTQPWRVFISYCQKDLPFLTALTKHLEPMKQAGWLSVWTDQCLKPGETWEPKLLEALAQAQLVLLLDSSDFAASEFIQKVELPQALALEKQGRLLVRIRVRALKRPSNDPLQAFQFLPRGDKPIEEYDDKLQNGAWAKVVTELEALILDAESKRSAPSTAPAEAEPPESPLAAPSPRSPAPSTAPAEAEPPPPLSPPGGRQSLLALLGGTVIVLLLVLLGMLVLLGRREGQPVPASSVVATPMASGPSGSKVWPLRVILLEDEQNSDFAPALAADKKKLRLHLAQELVPTLLKQGVRAIALDFSLSRETSTEAYAELRAMLQQAHDVSPPVPVVAIASEQSLFGECDPSAATTACLDALLPAELMEAPEPMEDGTPPAEGTKSLLFSEVSACIGERATLARVVASWLLELSEHREREATAAGKALSFMPPLRHGCIQRRTPVEQAVLATLPSYLKSQQVVLGQNEQSLEDHVVLIGMGHEAFGDLHWVRMPDGRDTFVAGPLLQAVAVESMLRENSMLREKGTP